jgi:3-phenylpropionate/trans-cinnamate dioxygenase ferredoxin reductase subunit
MDAGIVIVGAGHAGGSAAALLRQYGYTGGITLLGEEPLPPYQRPPLSKAWLKGEVGSDDLLLRPAAFYADKQIDLRVSTQVVSIDPHARRVALAGGESIAYDALILATGSRLRKLVAPGADLPGVLELRTAADGDRIRAALRPGARLAVVGGGYVGLEVAASARALGAEVVVLEREPRLLARVASTELSAYFAQLHRSHGVRIELGADLTGFDARDGRVAGVRLRDGRQFECDVAVVGIGALANEALASAAGIACQDGIVVDECARTSQEGVYAIGDCTRRPVPRYARALRLESVPNALEQAKQAAAHVCAKPVVKPEVPWFWSDQYDVRLQIVGMAFDVAHTVVRGDVTAGRFAVFHLGADGALQAVEAVNSPPEFVAGKMLVAAGKVIDPARLADTTISMKELAA